MISKGGLRYEVNISLELVYNSILQHCGIKTVQNEEPFKSNYCTYIKEEKFLNFKMTLRW